MATTNRTALILKLHKVLRKHYHPIEPDRERPALEHLLLACCLEDARYEAAEAAFAALRSSFFDWNEVRVSTINELAEAVKSLPEPQAAAARVRRILQSVFEATYSFDLEGLKKQNLGPALQKLEKTPGTSPFVVAYAVQAALGGHSIPLYRGALDALSIVGLGTADLESAGAGLERAIPKNKGPEFTSLLHQIGADLVASPHSPSLHKIFLEVAPDAKERLPKRGAKKPEPEAAAPETKPSPSAEPLAKEIKAKAAEPAKKKPEAKKAPAESKTKPGESKEKKAASPSKKKAAPSAKKPAAGISKRKPR
jgi:endonuclease-3